MSVTRNKVLTAKLLSPIPTKVMGYFFNLICYALFFVTALMRKMGARPGLDLILRRNGLILRRNGFQVIINDDLLEEEDVTANNSTLRVAYGFISNL